MASSFLEDLLEKEVDEKEVSAMVGSLESQLASTAIPRSHHNEVKASVAASKASPKQSIMTSKAPNQTSPIQNQTVSAVRPGISSSPVLNAGSNTTITTVVNIAPRPTVTTAVPLAPRPATMAVLAPNSGFTGTPRFVTAMINTDLVNRTNLSLINPQQITLAPRVVTGNVTVPGNPQAITTPQIIQQIQPRAANIGNMRSINPTQIVLQQATGSTPIQPDKKINIIQTQIRPVPASVSVSQNVPIRTSLASIRPQITSMQGTVTYRMPVNQVAVAPSKTAISSASGTVPKTTNTTNATNAGIHVSKTVVTNNVAAKQSTPLQTIPSPSVTHPQPQIRAQLEQIKEQAHKLNNFFSNLVRLASDQKSPDVGKTVKELVAGVMDGKLTEEQFAANLQTTLNSPPQPNLVGFLKKTLPMLRAQRSQSSAALLSHVQQSSTPQKILPQQQVQQKNTTATLANSPQIHKHNSQVQKIQIVQQPTQPGQPPVLKQVILTPAQQELFRRQQQINSQRVYLTTSAAAATPGSQVVTSSRSVVMVHAPPGSTAAKMAVASARSQAGTSSASTAADKLKPKGFTGISSSGDDDINDVTSMAGVNLMEESQRILAINSDLLSSQTRSCKEEPFLNITPFQKRLEALARKHGLSEVSQEVFNLVSHATQERLRNILEKLSTISLHRLEVYRDDPMYEVGLDIRSQLRVFEQIDEVERKKRDARERDILMRAVRSRSRQEDPEQARLKEKAKQLQQEEEEVIRKRAANSTALAAIGPRKKRKLDEALEGSSTSTAGSSSSSSSPLSSTALGNKKDTRQQVPRQRMRRVLLKDLIFVMEQEKETTKSLLLYKALLK